MAAVLTDINISPQRRFVKETERLFLPRGGRKLPLRKSEAPRQTRGWGAGETIFCVGERGVPGGISPLVKRPPGGLSVHFPPVESGRFPRARRRGTFPYREKKAPTGLFSFGGECGIRTHGAYARRFGSPQRRSAAGAPFDLTASVAGKTGSLRHDAGTGRRFLKTGAKKGLSALFFYLAESVGFEPTVLAHAGFQDRCLQPLGQLSG